MICVENFWTHNGRFSKQELLVNREQLPWLVHGSLIEVTQAVPPTEAEINSNYGSSSTAFNSNRSVVLRVSELEKMNVNQNYYKSVQISMAQHISSLFGFQPRQPVFVRQIDPSAVVAEYVEFNIKDQYVGRGDMFRLKNLLVGSCVYLGKKVSFAECVRAQIKEIYVKGSRVNSGYITYETKAIFRSESAKYFIFIQFCSDMLQFNAEGNIYNEMAMYGFLPDLFQRWQQLGVNHVVSIVLIARLFPKQYEIGHEGNIESLEYQDFYKVVVDWESRSNWSCMLPLLKIELLAFRNELDEYKDMVLSKSMDGNILESINMAINIFDKHYIDRDLTRTGLSIMIVTSSAGIFNTDRKLLRLTEVRMVEDGIGLDIVSLRRPPLHIVPLFRYKMKPKATASTSHEVLVESIPNNLMALTPSITANGPRPSHAAYMAFLNNEAWDTVDYNENNPTDDGMWCYQAPHWVDMSFYLNNSHGSERLVVPEHIFSHVKTSGFVEISWPRQTDVAVYPPEEYDSRVFNLECVKDELVLLDFQDKKPEVSSEQSISMLSKSLPNMQGFTSRRAFDKDRKVVARSKSPFLSFQKQDSKIAEFQRSPPKNNGLSSIHLNNLTPQNSHLLNHMNNLTKLNPFRLWQSMGMRRESGHLHRWNHIFPVNTFHDLDNTINWSSLCTPASLPLTTDYFPTLEELTELFQEYTYTISLNDDLFSPGYAITSDESLRNNFDKSKAFLFELIAQRLMQGFQLVVNGDIGESTGFSSILDKDDPVGRSKPYYLCMGQQVHQLAFDPFGENIEVKRFVRRSKHLTEAISSNCFIKAKNMRQYIMRRLKFSYPSFGDMNWNYLDQLVAGYQDELTDSLRFWRTRFVLIPLETMPQSSRFLNPQDEKLTDEELRLAGFYKFVELFHKARFVPADGSSDLSTKKTVGANIPITITTFQTSTFVANELAAVRKTSHNEGLLSQKNMSASNWLMEPMSKDSSYDLLASILQHPVHGLVIKDRRWHLRLYQNVFIGSECVDWFVRNIKDIASREEAVVFGNRLLDAGLLVHVNQKHRFLDGHYFYRFGRQYRLKSGREAELKGPLRWFRQRSITNSIVDQNIQNESREPLATSSTELTRKLLLNLDPSKKTERSEVAVLHYDTLYNPENCFHFELHWIICTARLVEDLIHSWSRIADKCGFKLVEAPVTQTKIDADTEYYEDNPFQVPTPIRLALRPPKLKSLPVNFFESKLLQSVGFVFDVEADNLHDPSAITYSYKRVPYIRTQFIHRTGSAFVQISNDGDGFFWVNNRLHNSHAYSNTGTTSRANVNPEMYRKDLENFCSDIERLQRFYNETASSVISDGFYDNVVDDDVTEKLIVNSEETGFPVRKTDDDQYPGQLLGRQRAASVHLCVTEYRQQDDEEPVNVLEKPDNGNAMDLDIGVARSNAIPIEKTKRTRSHSISGSIQKLVESNGDNSNIV